MSKSMELELFSPVGSIEAYVQRVMQMPLISEQEEHALAVRLRTANDLDAARQLVLSHLRFVVYVARSYAGYGLPQADIIQEGNIGLMKAIKRFDPDQNVRLVTFAVHWIRAEIHEYILKNWRIVKVATTKAQRKLFFNLRKMKARLGWFNRSEVEAVANDLGVKPEEVLEMEARLSNQDTAFDPYDEHDDTSRSTLAPAAYLTCMTDDPGVQLETDDWDERRVDRLKTALASLNERSRAIVERRWLTDDKATLQDLAAEYHVSAERIRQLENSAIQKLKQAVLEA